MKNLHSFALGLARTFALGFTRNFALGLAALAACFIANTPTVDAAYRVINFHNHYGGDVIVIVTSQRKLYYTLSKTKAIEYPIAVGRQGFQQFGWTQVTAKRNRPTWVPTARMRRENPKLPKSVGPGRRNPLGSRAINLSWNAIRIHGTNNPASIGKAVSSGCFRMHNKDVEHLYSFTQLGTPVLVIK